MRCGYDVFQLTSADNLSKDYSPIKLNQCLTYKLIHISPIRCILPIFVLLNADLKETFLVWWAILLLNQPLSRRNEPIRVKLKLLVSLCNFGPQILKRDIYPQIVVSLHHDAMAGCISRKKIRKKNLWVCPSSNNTGHSLDFAPFVVKVRNLIVVWPGLSSFLSLLPNPASQLLCVDLNCSLLKHVN